MTVRSGDLIWVLLKALSRSVLPPLAAEVQKIPAAWKQGAVWKQGVRLQPWPSLCAVALPVVLRPRALKPCTPSSLHTRASQATRDDTAVSWWLLPRFADFVGGASHLTSREISFHEQEYGLGGSLFEEQLFEEEEEEEEDDSFDADYRNCSLSYSRLDAD